MPKRVSWVALIVAGGLALFGFRLTENGEHCKRVQLDARAIGMGAGGGPQRGLITVLRGPWKREGRSNGQPSLLVRHRSSAERRWVEAYRQTALGSVVCRRYFGCGVDNCRNVFSVGQPETMKLTQVGLKRLQNSGGSRMRPVAKYMARSGAIHRNQIKAAFRPYGL